MAQSKMLRDFNFVTLPSKDFNCPICQSVLQEPFLTTCCGGHFCETCVKKVKKQNGECPLCKERPLNAVIDKYFKRQMGQLMVHCPQQKCKWTGELSKVNEHLATGQPAGDCQYVNVKCPLSCGLEILRKLLDGHVTNDCPYRSHSCQYCDFKSTHLEVTTQHKDVCLNYPCTCPNSCSPTIIKCHRMSEHLAQCPEQEIPCTFLETGCTKVMYRKQLQEHLETNIIEHQILTCKALSTMELETQRKMQAIKQQHQLEIAAVRVELESKARQAEYWINGFKLMAKEVKKNNWPLYLSRMSELVCSTSPTVGPVTISLPNITKTLNNNHRFSSKQHSYSSPFYTHPQGYKMLLYVEIKERSRNFVAGQSCGQDNIVVGLCIVKGEHDEYLKWPVQGKVTLLLLNSQQDDAHREAIYNFTATRYIDDHSETSWPRDSYRFSEKQVWQHQLRNLKAKYTHFHKAPIAAMGSSQSLDHHQCIVEYPGGVKFSFNAYDNHFSGDQIYFEVTIGPPMTT